LAFSFVEGCDVEQAPPPINDCPRPEIAFTGIGVVPECVSISATGEVTMNPMIIVPTVDIMVTREQTTTPGLPPHCLFTFDMNFNLPGNGAPPCIAFSFESLSITEQRAIVVPVLMAQMVTMSSSSIGCQHKVQMEIKLPDRRIYPAEILVATEGCTTVSVRTVAPAPVWDLTANIWLRNCCNGKTLTAGKRVWITLTDFGWSIIGTEEILIVPVNITSAMVAGECTGVFSYATGTTITITDPLDMFQCVFDGAHGYALCNDPFGTGEWELVYAEQYALTIQFRVGSDPFEDAGPIEVFLVESHHGEPPPLVSLKLEVNNPLYFASSQNRLGFAMRRNDCEYDVWQVQCSIGAGVP
jgi:hypothetical protein